MGVVTPIRMRDKEREKAHGVIRGMTPMEDMAMKAHAAYDTTSPVRRLDVVPDVQGFGTIAKQLLKVPLILKRGENIVDTVKTLEKLPPVKEGHVRLFRGQHPTKHEADIFTDKFGPKHDYGKGGWFTDDLAYADYFRASQPPGAEIVYLDVPKEVAKKGALRNRPDLQKAVPFPEENAVFLEEFRQTPKKMRRGDRAGPIVNDKLLPQSRKPPTSKTEVTPFELQQMGLSKGAPSSTGGADRYRATRGKKK